MACLRLNIGRNVISRKHSALSFRSKGCNARKPAIQRLKVLSKIEYTTPSKVADLVEAGYTIVDVRDETQFGRAHLKDSVHIPLFTEDTSTDLNSIVNQQLHKGSVGNFKGTKHTVRNERFEETAQKLFPEKDAKLIIACQQGMRSTSAAEALVQLGYSNLTCIEGGYNDFKEVPAPLETIGESDLDKAALGGMQAAQTTINVAVAGVLFALYLCLEFFPESGKDALKAIYDSTGIMDPPTW